MLQRPAVLFPDVLAWATPYLRAALEARSEAYCAGVTVRPQKPEDEADDRPPVSGRLVTIRDDGGPRDPAVTRTSTLGINVYAPKAKDAKDLALMVAALFEAAVGSGAVVGHTGTSGPIALSDAADNGRPHLYLSVDLRVRGSAL